MFRILLLFSGLLGGLALAQITRERDGAAPATGTEPADGSDGDDPRELVAVMLEPAPSDAATETTADPEESVATAEVDGGSAIDEMDEADTLDEAVAEGTEIDVIVDGIVADDLEAEVAAKRANRRVRALVVGGIAAAAGLAIGYVAIRRVRPDLISAGAIRGMRPAFALPAIVLPSITRPTIDLPEIDTAEVRRIRIPALDGTRLGAAAPAIRSAVSSAIASAIATSLARRITRR